MPERSLKFGAGLIGTLCLPDVLPPRAETPGLVLFNAGVVHRIGPHRVHVKLARALAERGVPSLRFDLHGLGDSAAGDGSLDYARQVTADLRVALDELGRACGSTRFSLLGFCSGVLPSVHCALADERVRQVVLFDGIDVTTSRARRRRLLLRMRAHALEPRAYARAVWRGFQGLRGALRLATPAAQQRVVEPMFPRPIDLAAALSELVARGVDVHVVHAGSDHGEVNYAQQAAEAFVSTGVVGLHFAWLDTVDHVLTTVPAQHRFVKYLCETVACAAHEPGDAEVAA